MKKHGGRKYKHSKKTFEGNVDIEVVSSSYERKTFKLECPYDIVAQVSTIDPKSQQ